MLRKIVTALIVVPLAVVLIALAVANRANVTVSFDPFGGNEPAAAATLPLFALIILLLVVGVVVGGIAVWLGQGRFRRSARRLEREAAGLRRKLDALEGKTHEYGIVPGESAPPPRLRLRPPAG